MPAHADETATPQSPKLRHHERRRLAGLRICLTQFTYPSAIHQGPPMSMIDRVKNILMSPKTEWPTIAGEATTTQQLYTGYIMILAAIGPIAMLLHSTLTGVVAAIITYLLSLVMLYIVALIVDVLAPTFGEGKGRARDGNIAGSRRGVRRIN